MPPRERCHRCRALTQNGEGPQCQRPASCHVGGEEHSCDLKCWQHAYVHIPGRVCRDEDRIHEHVLNYRDNEARYLDGYMDAHGHILGSCSVWALCNLLTNPVINPREMEAWLRDHSRYYRNRYQGDQLVHITRMGAGIVVAAIFEYIIRNINIRRRPLNVWYQKTVLRPRWNRNNMSVNEFMTVFIAGNYITKTGALLSGYGYKRVDTGQFEQFYDNAIGEDEGRRVWTCLGHAMAVKYDQARDAWWVYDNNFRRRRIIRNITDLTMGPGLVGDNRYHFIEFTYAAIQIRGVDANPENRRLVQYAVEEERRW